MMSNLKRNWLVSSKLTWGIWWILTRALKNVKNLHCNGLFLSKLYNLWARRVQRSYVWWHIGLMQSLKENWLVLSKNDMKNLANFHRLKNSDFIMESKMVELNKNKNSKQSDWQDAVQKLYSTLKINEHHNKQNFLHMFYRLFLRYNKIFKKVVKLVFFNVSVHVFLGHDGCFW